MADVNQQYYRWMNDPEVTQYRFADVELLIGEKDCWHRGYVSEVIGCLVHYAFDVLNLHKLTAGCCAAHQASLKAFKKNGFQDEKKTVQKHGDADKGQTTDSGYDPAFVKKAGYVLAGRLARLFQ